MFVITFSNTTIIHEKFRWTQVCTKIISLKSLQKLLLPGTIDSYRNACKTEILAMTQE